jgi:hypothetical protein
LRVTISENRFPPGIECGAGFSASRPSPAIVARPAIVPRSLDRGIFIQVFEMNRFSMLA